MTNTLGTSLPCPVQVDLEEGKTYKWCSCGRSKTQPFCDESHTGTDHEPYTFVASKTETVILCGCQATDDPPYCDGTHNIL